MKHVDRQANGYDPPNTRSFYALRTEDA